MSKWQTSKFDYKQENFRLPRAVYDDIMRLVDLGYFKDKTAFYRGAITFFLALYKNKLKRESQCKESEIAYKHARAVAKSPPPSPPGPAGTNSV